MLREKVLEVIEQGLWLHARSAELPRDLVGVELVAVAPQLGERTPCTDLIPPARPELLDEVGLDLGGEEPGPEVVRGVEERVVIHQVTLRVARRDGEGVGPPEQLTIDRLRILPALVPANLEQQLPGVASQHVQLANGGGMDERVELLASQAHLLGEPPRVLEGSSRTNA